MFQGWVTGANTCTNTELAYFRYSTAFVKWSCLGSFRMRHDNKSEKQLQREHKHRNIYFRRSLSILIELFFIATLFPIFFSNSLETMLTTPIVAISASTCLMQSVQISSRSIFFLVKMRVIISNTSGCGTEKERDLGEPPAWHSDAEIWFSIR